MGDYVSMGLVQGGDNDGVSAGVKLDRERRYLTSPRLFEAVREGRVFHGNIAAAGVVLPIFSNTTQQVGLFNPQGSDVDAIVHSVALTYVDTTGAAGGFVLGYLSGCPSSAATGTNIAVFTSTAPINAYLGGGLAPKVLFGQGNTLTVTAPAILRHVGLNQTVLTAATTGSPQWFAYKEFDDLVVAPGSAIFIAGNIATLIKVAGTITWEERPR